MLTNYEGILNNYAARIDEDVAHRVQFIRDQLEQSGLGGLVVGVSGGIDSAVVSALALKALGQEKVVGVWMPAYSHPVHQADAQALAQAIGLNLITVNLNKTTDELLAAVTTGMRAGGLLKPQEELCTLTIGNTKARVRMTTLYGIAGQLGYLVLGTCNRTENHLGYETKGGDQICDFNPIAGIVKAQVRILAKNLGIPESIINKAPSADLWTDQTDEGEMGFTYEQADKILLTGAGNPEVIASMELLHRRSEHKRALAPGL
jgi:NAD+ synthase